jgi:hypothetical protein
MFQFIFVIPCSNSYKSGKKLTTGVAPQKAHTGCTIFGKTVYIFGKTVHTNTQQRPNQRFRQSKLKVANMHYKPHTGIHLRKEPKSESEYRYMSMSKGAGKINGNNYENG